MMLQRIKRIEPRDKVQIVGSFMAFPGSVWVALYHDWRVAVVVAVLGGWIAVAGGFIRNRSERS